LKFYSEILRTRKKTNPAFKEHLGFDCGLGFWPRSFVQKCGQKCQTCLEANWPWLTKLGNVISTIKHQGCYTLDIGRRCKLFNYLYLGSIHLYSSFVHPVSENYPFPYNKMTFSQLRTISFSSHLLRTLSRFFKAFQESLSINREIVHEHFHDLFNHVREDWHHATLKRGWSIT
jgi:hypothetical protein